MTGSFNWKVMLCSEPSWGSHFQDNEFSELPINYYQANWCWVSEEPPRFNVPTTQRMTTITQRMTTTHYFFMSQFYYIILQTRQSHGHTHTHATILAEHTLGRTAAVWHWWWTFLALPVYRRFRNRTCNHLPYCVGCSGSVCAPTSLLSTQYSLQSTSVIFRPSLLRASFSNGESRQVHRTAHVTHAMHGIDTGYIYMYI